MDFTSLIYIEEDSTRVLDELLKSVNRFSIIELGQINEDYKIESVCAVYAILLDDNIEYIGKTKNLRGRFRSHFIKEPSGSHRSQYRNIRLQIDRGKKIEFSYVEVPKLIYSSIEEGVIITLRNQNKEPKWNKRSS